MPELFRDFWKWRNAGAHRADFRRVRLRFYLPWLIVAMTTATVGRAFGQATAPGIDASSHSATELAIERARGRIRYGLDLAERGAVYSAQQEFIQALRLLATDLDLPTGTRDHEAALDAGVRAIDSLDTSAVAAIQAGAEPSSRVSAMQRQLFQAQERLVFGVGCRPTASMALYLLGQSQTAAVGETPEEKALAGPKAIALYQAALAVDPANCLAANELGTLFVKYGRFEEAERVLAHGVAVAPHPAMWHNLVVVYERMGNAAAARNAQAQCDALIAARRAKGENMDPLAAHGVAAKIRWTDVAEFVRCSAGDDCGPPVSHEAAAAGKTAAAEKRVAPKLEPKRAAGLSLTDWMASPLRALGVNVAPSQSQ